LLHLGCQVRMGGKGAGWGQLFPPKGMMARPQREVRGACVCVCVCVCVCMCVCAGVSMCVCVCVCVCGYTLLYRIHLYTQCVVCMYTHIHMYTHIPMYTHIHMYIYMHTYEKGTYLVHVYIRKRAWQTYYGHRLHVYLFMHRHMHSYIHTYVHVHVYFYMGWH